VVIPFPSGAVFYPLFVAQEKGWFAEEGIEVTVEPVDGSGATIQQLAAGQAQVAVPSPGPFMQAVARGEDLRSVYTLYQSNVFSIQAPADSDIRSLADLEGKTVGVGALDGGETPFVRAALKEVADLDEGGVTGGPYPILTGDYSATPPWRRHPIAVGSPVAKPTPIFTKLDPAVVEEELARLGG
jgi:ABC-type nitrate/sulfonate/bicarbonate transport system substrate-binding protein